MRAKRKRAAGALSAWLACAMVLSACASTPASAVADDAEAPDTAEVVEDASDRASDTPETDSALDATARDATLDATARDATLDATARDATLDAADAGRRAIVVSAYYAGWMQDAVAPSTIDFASLTEVHHFSLVPRADGTLDAAENGITAAHARAIVAAAHGARRKVLISVGGAGTLDGFRGAWSDGNRAAFVAAITRFATTWGYDGVDVDVEPLQRSDATRFQAFVRALKASLDAARPGMILTAAAGDAPEAYASVQSLFDQINVMTYDLSGPWPGWVTWHNTPLHNGGMRFPSTGDVLPSVETTLANFTAAGVRASALGLGVDLYGYDWRGASAPLRAICGVTTRTLSYAEIMDTLWRPDRARWDATAMVPWLSIDNPGGADDHFISYDDERSAAAKVDYARARGLRSVILWELGGGWRASQPAGSRDVILRAVGRAAAGG